MSNLNRLRAYYLSRLVRSRPHTLFYNPVLACDCRCQHCGIWKAEQTNESAANTSLTPSEIKNIFADPFFNSINSLWLLGGEPTRREDLIEVLKSFRQAIPTLTNITIGTTGVSPDKLESHFADYLASEEAVGVNYYFHISLDGAGKVHDAVRGTKGAFEQVQESVELVKAWQNRSPQPGIDLGLNCVIQPANSESLDDVLIIAKEWNVPITFNIVQVGNNFYQNAERDSKLTFTTRQREAVNAFLEQQRALCPPYHTGHYANVLSILNGGIRSRRCVTMDTTMYIDPDGTVFPCPESYTQQLGSLRDIPAGSIWKRVGGHSGGVRKELCDDCALGCSFGDGMSLSEYWSILNTDNLNPEADTTIGQVA